MDWGGDNRSDCGVYPENIVKSLVGAVLPGYHLFVLREVENIYLEFTRSRIKRGSVQLLMPRDDGKPIINSFLSKTESYQPTVRPL